MTQRSPYRRYRFQPAGGSLYPPFPPVVKGIIIANVVVFFLQNVFRGVLETWFAVSAYDVLQRVYVWQPFTYMWLHGGLWHLALNMLTLWMFGSQLELEWGSRRFLRFYLQGGIGAGVIIALWNWMTRQVEPTIGASGAIYAVLTAWSVLWPDRVIVLLFPPIPIKAAYVVPLFLLLDLYTNLRVSHVGHIGGALVGLFLVRHEWQRALSLSSLRFRWHRWRMRNRLRAVQREEWRRREDERRRPH